jgi:hypothetical protein
MPTMLVGGIIIYAQGQPSRPRPTSTYFLSPSWKVSGLVKLSVKKCLEQMTVDPLPKFLTPCLLCYPKLKIEGAAGRLPHLPSFSREEATRLDACSKRSVVYAVSPREKHSSIHGTGACTRGPVGSCVRVAGMSIYVYVL